LRKLRQIAEAFAIEAQNDLEAAAVMLNNRLFSKCLEHSQTAVEKGLKAGLALRGVISSEHEVSSFQRVCEKSIDKKFWLPVTEHWGDGALGHWERGHWGNGAMGHWGKKQKHFTTIFCSNAPMPSLAPTLQRPLSQRSNAPTLQRPNAPTPRCCHECL